LLPKVAAAVAVAGGAEAVEQPGAEAEAAAQYLLVAQVALQLPAQ